jgi:hypothetical protein
MPTIQNGILQCDMQVGKADKTGVKSTASEAHISQYGKQRRANKQPSREERNHTVATSAATAWWRTCVNTSPRMAGSRSCCSRFHAPSAPETCASIQKQKLTTKKFTI